MSPRTEVLLGGDFYVTGGTLRPDAPCYVERQADKQLCQSLLNGEFCYVLTSRQMGKSSLMIRTVRRLRQDGVAVAVLDLTAIGQNLTIEQWYDGLVSRLGQQLRLEDELAAFWASHPEFGPLQRWTAALEQVVLKQIASEVVIFVDEIDIVRSLPFSTDEFFAAIRECYNRRSHEPAFNRLAFGLLGVATPTDLIRDTRMTPFNIGRRIELNDFTPEEARPLAAGLGPDGHTAGELLNRVLYWTGGHPYLTQRLCRALADDISAQLTQSPPGSPPAPPVLPTIRDVDRAAEKLFLSRQARDRDDNLIFVRERILRSEVDVTALLLLYRKIHLGELVHDDETNPLVSILHLSGIARGVNGYLQVRNRIYRQVFDLVWIQTNMPEAEVRRQKRAGRRGMFIGFATAAVLLLSYLVLGPIWREYREATLARKTAEGLERVYGRAKAYRDSFETKIELGLGGSTVPVGGSGSLTYEAPDRVILAFKSQLSSPDTELEYRSAGPFGVLYSPAEKEFQPLLRTDGRMPRDLSVFISRSLATNLGAAVLGAQPSPGAPKANDGSVPAPPRPPKRGEGGFLIPRPQSVNPRTGSLFPGLESLPPQIGPLSVLPVYRLFLEPGAARHFLEQAQNLLPAGYAQIDGQPARILEWDYEAKPFLDSLGVKEDPAAPTRIPIRAWINTSNNLVLQLRIDLSNWARRLAGTPPELPVTSLVITENHRSIQIDSLSPNTPDSAPERPEKGRGPGHRGPHLTNLLALLERAGTDTEALSRLLQSGPGLFGGGIPADAKAVERLSLPPLNFGKLVSPQREFTRLIPARLRFVPANLIDLSDYYNAAFEQTWHPGVENNNLKMLSTGVLQMGGTPFDVRGIVQLGGKRLRDVGGHYPQQISGIKIGRICRALNFLHGTGYPAARDGIQVGAYIIHYANGHQETIPLIYGEDLRDWVEGSDRSTSLSRATIVWRASNDARFVVRLFKSTWINPLPDTEITSIDFVSSMADPAPFLIALTTEPAL